MYGSKLRVRASGILVEGEKMLLIQLRSPVSKNLVWIPPGGGVEFGESIKNTVQREFLEETGLVVSVHNLLFINELIEPPFHALEFFFRVERISGELKLGEDPEHSVDEQILKDLQFIKRSAFQDLGINSNLLSNIFWDNKTEGEPFCYFLKDEVE